MRMILLSILALFALVLSYGAKADDTALVPVGLAVGANITELAVSGVLTPPVAVMTPIAGFFYLTFETGYKPYEVLFGKDHVFYEYPSITHG